MISGVDSCRRDFPALQRKIDDRQIVYLDNAATSLKPVSVIDAVADFYRNNGASVHRGRHALSEEASDAFETVRSRVAGLIGALPQEVVFLKNATEGLNCLASGFGLNETDLVLGCLDAHHSQLLPWRRVASLRLVRVDRHGRLDLDHFRELLKLQPKVLAITHASNVTGVVHPIAAMVAEAKQTCESVIVVDATQSIPHLPVDVSKVPIDFLVWSGHKMLAPTGVGCLYGRSPALEELRPLMVGGGMADWVDGQTHVERRVPHRHEAGTPAISSVIGLGEAVAYLGALDPAWRQSHTAGLALALIDGARARPYMNLLGPMEITDRLPIASFRIPGCEQAGELAHLLSDAYSIQCRTGYMCAQPLVRAIAGGEVLRASAYFYNQLSEIEALFSALDELADSMQWAVNVPSGNI